MVLLSSADRIDSVLLLALLALAAAVRWHGTAFVRAPVKAL